MSVEYATDPAVLQLQRTPERGRATTEADLVRAYSGTPAARPTARKPCACRGWIEADPHNPAPGVQLHRATGQHEAWSLARARENGYTVRVGVSDNDSNRMRSARSQVLTPLEAASSFPPGVRR